MLKLRIPLTEPQSTRYLYINPTTNKVHLLVPFIAGFEISSDNTCKASLELRTFFETAAIAELENYQSALKFDIALLETENPLRKAKEERLLQINHYLEAVKAMRDSYGNSVTAFLNKPSNLYSIQLRPRSQDPYSRVVNPVFTVNRKNDEGLPLSALYNKMHELYPNVTIAVKSPRQTLIDVTMEAFEKETRDGTVFDLIKKNLEEQAKILNLPLDLAKGYQKDSKGNLVKDSKDNSIKIEFEKADIDAMLGITNADAKDYIEALLNKCAGNLETVVETSPFYLKQLEDKEKKAEHLSILTQFYLGVLNVYCKARGLSQKNFGEILDKNPVLSQELVETIAEALNKGNSVEEAICNICSFNAMAFGLNRRLSPEDKKKIQEKFDSSYKSITATKENPHMDDFMLLDTEAEGDTAKFVSHQDLICTDFANLVDPSCPNQVYFESIRKDKVDRIPSPRTSPIPEIEVEVETLINNLSDIQWEKLPQAAREACQKHPAFQSRQFSDDVAKGKQAEAEAFLNAAQEKQVLLQQSSKFTDYSGRTFECTAYEYAYWAKDTHMRRMLEAHMDDETKAILLEKINQIEEVGLTYTQHGEKITSKHFDFSPLIKALENYLDKYNKWDKNNTDENWHAMEQAFLAVGKAQRDVPAHVAQEYCRTDFSFEITAKDKITGKDTSTLFKEPSLPRGLTFDNWVTNTSTWFPLSAGTSGLGFDFAIVKAVRAAGCGRRGGAVDALSRFGGHVPP